MVTMGPELSSANVPRFLGVDHVEFAVADVDSASEIHHRLGFVRVATRELRERRLKSYRLASGSLSVVLSQSRLQTDPIAIAVAKHGDGIFSLGFLCQDALSTLERMHQRNGQVVEAPRTVQLGEDAQSQTQAQVLAFGHVRHTLVSRSGGPFLEGFPSMPATMPAGFGIERALGWTAFVESADFPTSATHYATLLGLTRREDATDEYRCRWTTSDGSFRPEMWSPPPSASPQDRVREFLDVNHGAGVGEVTLVAANRDDTIARINAAGLAVEAETGLTAPIAGMLRYRIVGAS